MRCQGNEVNLNIAIHDNASGKFSQMIMNWWRKKGHDVRFEMGANPEAFSSWADLIYIDFMDGNFDCKPTTSL